MKRTVNFGFRMTAQSGVMKGRINMTAPNGRNFGFNPKEFRIQSRMTEKMVFFFWMNRIYHDGAFCLSDLVSATAGRISI